MPASPFDTPGDGTDEEIASSDPATLRQERYARVRKRTLIGGMLALLVLVWVRELLGVPTEVLWLFAMGILICVVGVYVTANETTRRQRLQSHRHRLRDERRREREAIDAMAREAAAERAHRAAAEAWAKQNCCPDCDGVMRPIKLINRDDARHRPVEYAEADAEASLFFGRYRVAGEVFGEMCDQCGRIQLRGLPR